MLPLDIIIWGHIISCGVHFSNDNVGVPGQLKHTQNPNNEHEVHGGFIS